MNRRTLTLTCIFLVLTLVVSGCAKQGENKTAAPAKHTQTATAASPKWSAQEESDLKSLINKITVATMTLDYRTMTGQELVPYLTTEAAADLVKNGKDKQIAQSYRDQKIISKFMGDIKYEKFDIDDQSNSAMAIYDFDCSVSKAGAPATTDKMKANTIFKKENGNWKLLTYQVSRTQ